MIPRKPDKSKHSAQIVVRLTRDMDSAIRALALEKGLTVADYVRDILTQHLQQVKERSA